MRETKFRAWLKDEKKMVEVKEIIFAPEKQIAYDAEYRNGKSLPFHYLKYKLFNDIELIQYTGLKDKNRVEIHEGDIVKRNIIERYQVAWNDKESCWYIFNRDVKHNFSNISTLDNNVKNLEVIGNIYDNEELLNENIRFY